MEIHYDWPRFLIPRDGGIGLDALGFLRDPDDEFGRLENPDLLRLADIADRGVVALLGEPGMGKSTLLGDLRDLSADKGRRAILIDLAGYGSEDRLLRFLNAPEILAAGTTEPAADLLLDGIDVCPLEIPTLVSVLAEAFRGYPATQDLRIRLTCRSAVWPSLLEDTLNEHWGEACVTVAELAPLRRCDVEVAAVAEGLDPDVFLAEIEKHHAGVFAARPVTLRLLFRLAKSGRSFPTERTDLYRQGCELLCADDNPFRRASRRLGNRTPSQRLTIAARIAAVLLLTGREAVWIGPYADLDRENDCSIDDLVGQALMPDGTALHLSHEDVQETLDTGLFWLRGPNRLHFAHQTYGEFLAAWYLQVQRLPAPRKLALLSGPDGGGLVRQLHEVTAWAAALDRDLFRSVLELYPPVLLASDVATAAPELRESLVEGVLTLANAAGWTETDWGLRMHYPGLDHPHLSTQLRPWIEGGGHFIVARRIAIDIAKACRRSDLQDALLQLALGDAEHLSIRRRAVDALAKVADQAHKRALRPLLALSPEEDPEDELTGTALQVMWPEAIDIDTLLRRLQPPRKPSLFGAYWWFLSEQFAPSLSPADLPRALRWVRHHILEDRFDGGAFDVAPKILIRACECLDAPLVAPEIARTILTLLEAGRSLLPYDLEESDNNSLRDDGLRRRLLLAILPLLQDPDRDSWLFRCWGLGSAILQPGDVDWLLDQARIAASPTTCWTFARLIQEVFEPSQDPHLAKRILDVCDEQPLLRRAMPKLCRTVGLSSCQARSIRDRAQRRARETKPSPPPLTPPPQTRIAATLERIESGDADAFVALLLNLRAHPDGRYVYGLPADLRELPGWQAADEATRGRIVVAACDYLRRGEPHHDKLIEIDQPLHSTEAAVHALYLRDALGRETGNVLPNPDWLRWAPVMLERFNRIWSNDPEWAKDALRLGYQQAPVLLRETIRRLLLRDIEVDSWARTTAGLESIWDPEIAALLFANVDAARRSPGVFRSLFRMLLRQDRDRGGQYGLDLLGSFPEVLTDAEREIAFIVSDLSIKHRIEGTWPLIWRTMQRDAQFAERLAISLADDWERDEDWRGWLSPSDLGELGLWLEAGLPEDDRKEVGRDRANLDLHGSRFDLEQLRNNILSALANRGTADAVAAVERICVAFPENLWLRRRLTKARESLSRSTWIPPSSSELLELTSNSRKRLVRSDSELLAVVLESLARLQDRLQGWNSLVRSLWNESKQDQPNAWRPKDENFLSDFVKDHLTRDLAGVVAQREVEVQRPKIQGIGERTDLLVTVTTTSPHGDIGTAAVVIECKGCWHKDLDTAMKDQLKQRYLIDEDHRCGIYLVGWFVSERWDKKDGRREKTPNWTREQAVSRLSDQAKSLSDSVAEIQAFVLDASAPSVGGT